MAMKKKRIIEQDGKRYEFTPGAGGSLMAEPIRRRLPEPLVPASRKVAKTVGRPPALYSMRTVNGKRVFSR
jgi:hypothetical protein